MLKKMVYTLHLGHPSNFFYFYITAEE